MRKHIFIILLFFGCGLGLIQSNAQEEILAARPLDNIFEKEHIASKKPIPYPSLREADIVWSKRVWRVIDLREKINLPLYYPTDFRDDRYSLIGLFLHGIQYEGLPAYSINDDEFRIMIGWDDVQNVMGAATEMQEVVNPETGEITQQEISTNVRVDEVKQLLVKEVWYFDKNYSRMDVRILGICPIREYANEAGEMVKRQTFWIYFPEARDLMARHEVFNATNDAQRRSFDDVFIKRYFGSYITQETNVYNNRNIESYAVGIDAALEAQRIKNEIFTFEQDLWHY